MLSMVPGTLSRNAYLLLYYDNQRGDVVTLDLDSGLCPVSHGVVPIPSPQ